MNHRHWHRDHDGSPPSPASPHDDDNANIGYGNDYHDEDDGEIVYYDDGIAAGGDGGGSLLRWTFSQSQSSQPSQGGSGRPTSAHRTSTAAAAAAAAVSSTVNVAPVVGANASSKVLPRIERRRRRDEHDDGNYYQHGSDTIGARSPASSVESGNDPGRGNAKSSDGRNHSQEEEGDSEDPFASLQSYLDMKDDLGEDDVPAAAAGDTVVHPQDDGEAYHHGHDDGEGDAYSNCYSPSTSPVNRRTSGGVPVATNTYPYDNYVLSDDDDGGGCGIDMKELRRQSMKRSKPGGGRSTTGTAATLSKRRKSLLVAAHDDLADLTNASAGNEEVLMAAWRAAKPPGGGGGRGALRAQGKNNRSNTGRGRDSSGGVKKAKSSIVGSRPTHWGAAAASRASASKKHSMVQAATKTSKKKLSDATKIRSAIDRAAAVASSRRKSSNGSRGKILTRDEVMAPPPGGTNDATGTDDAAAVHTPAGTSKANASSPEPVGTASKWEKDVNLREMDFAPPFIGRHSDAAAFNLSIQDELEFTTPASGLGRSQGLTTNMSPLARFNLDGHEDSTDPNAVSSISATPGMLSGKRSRRRGKPGTLMMTLREIRSASEGDCMRLKSGANPHDRDLTRRRRTTDVSDPRNRASSKVDVTLMGDASPWEGGIKRTTILGYVHSTEVKKNTEAAPQALPKSETFAWICLDYDTVNEQRVGRGTQLRIYDPMTIPFLSAWPNGNPYSVLPLMACTRMCEVYPDNLPPLSAVPQLTG